MVEPCSYCQSVDVVELRSEGCLVCASCGTVLGGVFDEKESFFANGDDSAVCMLRHGAPMNPLLKDSSLSTMMQYSARYRKIKQLHDRISMNYTERALYHAFNFIGRTMEDKLSLPNLVSDTAKAMYKDTKEQRISRGLIHKALTAACVYYACKVHNNVQRTKQEIADAFGVTTTKLNKACKIFRDLAKDKPYFQGIFEEISISNIASRMVGRLTWKDDREKFNVIRVIRTLDDVLQQYGTLDNKHINSIMAALVFIAANQLDVQLTSPDTLKMFRVSKTLVCSTYDVTLITLNKTIEEIERSIAKHVNEGGSSTVAIVQLEQRQRSC
jgi:transcription initiation factor TFIIIB Brf1 subunit/transcription initiation factor TFIIB